MKRPAVLDRLSPLWRRSPGVMPGYSRWTLLADATLATALTLAVVDGALNPFLPTAPAPTVLGAQPPALTRDNLLLPMTLHGGPVHPLQLVLASLIAVPLVGRRRYPLSVFWVVIVATVLYHYSPGYDATYP